MSSSTIYLPATKDRPAEPAPYVLDAADMLRLARVDSADPYSVLKRWRKKGWLRGTKLSHDVVFLLPDALKCLEMAREEDPR